VFSVLPRCQASRVAWGARAGRRPPDPSGLRLDYVFATQPLALRSTSAEIDRQERKGDKPSDA